MQQVLKFLASSPVATKYIEAGRQDKSRQFLHQVRELWRSHSDTQQVLLQSEYLNALFREWENVQNNYFHFRGH